MEMGKVFDILGAVYAFEKSTAVIVFAVGAVALLAALLIVRRPVDRRVKIVLFVVAALAFVIFGPMILNDRIEVTPSSFSLRTGFWFYPTKHQFQIKDVGSIEVIETNDRKNK